MKLSEDAYIKFKEHLFSGTFAPGQFVSQRELVRLIGVPLGPVREALLRLNTEGMVQIIPQRGVKIAEANLKLIRNTFHLRICLEKEAAAKYSETAIDKDIKELERIHLSVVERAGKEGVTDSLLQEAQEVDWKLHNTLVEALDNEIISEIHKINNDRIRLIRLDHGLLTRPSLLHAMEEHLAVIKACIERDEAAAAHAMEVHLSTALRRAMGV